MGGRLPTAVTLGYDEGGVGGVEGIPDKEGIPPSTCCEARLLPDGFRASSEEEVCAEYVDGGREMFPIKSGVSGELAAMLGGREELLGLGVESPK